ncbi:MAG: methenyltetrahydromethanopterin cyclohydrolase [Candidatus Heimdallarchaeota archaeon]|nr:methenyltetrahydromethanopterin cyclohydrolase [Candidatus Heimdallarchaeota archaeon]
MSNKKKIIETNMNEAAVELFDEMLEMEEILRGILVDTDIGPSIFDLGVKAQGGFLAGEYTTQVCLGGLAEVSLGLKSYDDLILPTITVITDFPAIATMGSQFAGWSINKDGYQAMGSGPARILAKKPKDIYEQLPFKEKHNETVIVLETNKYPTDKIMTYIAEKCGIVLEGLCIIVTPTTSVAGSTQVSGRSVETAIHKLHTIGFDITAIQTACGIAPIAPIAKKSDIMLGRTNDMLIYGSDVYLQVDYKDDSELKEFLEKTISSNSSSYGSLFFDVVKKVQGDFYKIDPALFAPAKLTINNVNSGKTFSAGKINIDMLRKSVSL